MIIKVKQEEVKSVDPDYKGQQFYHEGEKIKLLDGREGIFKGVERRNYPDDDLIIVKLED
ncbi:hypothetical protein [Halothermothrix orenii]|uniref:Uncharacterized protein n=1 Tax=Halothermothrix orenii (strain H 168 / OCM 544 / DSM 9562) TaxID=373903 RepID=B8D1P3_HALOH|nr:hypothetical protein [Halothermothrix orenii]ACL69120.1 hypothetical protein Hore_03590 [Halothermothrix orenii H 168]